MSLVTTDVAPRSWWGGALLDEKGNRLERQQPPGLLELIDDSMRNAVAATTRALEKDIWGDPADARVATLRASILGKPPDEEKRLLGLSECLG